MGKPFYEATLQYIMGELHYPKQPEKRRVMAIVYEGDKIVEKVKRYFGPTNPEEAKRLAKEKGINALSGTCAVMYLTPGFTYHSIHKWIMKLARRY